MSKSILRDLDTYEREPLERAELPDLQDREESKAEAKPLLPRNTFLRSFGFAFQGITYTLRTQRNMRVHLALGCIVVGLAFGLGMSPVEWAILLVTMALVYCLEMLNTVIEAVVDMITQEYHPLAKVAKDVAAGAVLVAAIFAVAIAAFLLGPRILQAVLSLF